VLPSEVAEGFLFINELIDLQPPVPTNLPVEMFKLMIGGDLRFTRKRLRLHALGKLAFVSGSETI